MGTFAFCEILYSVLRQSCFRLVHEFNGSSRRFLCCKIYKDNFTNQVPGVRFAPKWYHGVSFCSCQNSNIITMPKHKLDNSSDQHKEKKSKKSNEINLKINSLKHKKKKKKKSHRNHHKERKTHGRSPKEKKLIVKKVELITLDSSSDSDICVIYDSKIKNKSFEPHHSKVKVKVGEKANGYSELNVITIESDERIEESEQIENNKEDESTVCNVSEQCSSAKPSSKSDYSKEQSHTESHTSIPCGDISSFLKSDEDGPLSGTPSDQNTSKFRTKSKWEFTDFGQTMTSSTKGSSPKEENYLMFNVLSYNVLCQEIMQQHMHLYTDNDPTALNWDFRSKLLMKEFVDFDADVLCLQEVQESHLESFYNQLRDLGYSGVFKRRTGDKTDGVAIYFKNSTFKLIDYTTVEYYQPGVPVLNRDNVGLIVKLAPKMKPDERVIVATTHLLYNPRRHDVKLAQVQVLLAEVERFAFKKIDERTKMTKYWPVILTGDMNFEPNAGGFKLLNLGRFQFDGLCSKTLTTEFYGYSQVLGKELIPSFLGVTDTCQHLSIVAERNLQITSDTFNEPKDDHKSEVALLQIYNSDFKRSSLSDDARFAKYKEIYEVYTQTHKGFGTGQLHHALQLTSVYNYDPQECSNRTQVSTFQSEWIVVDYIFYSKQEGNLKLVARYKLLSAAEAIAEGPIPNLSSPSDHYPLAAKFALVF